MILHANIAQFINESRQVQLLPLELSLLSQLAGGEPVEGLPNGTHDLGLVFWKELVLQTVGHCCHELLQVTLGLDLELVGHQDPLLQVLIELQLLLAHLQDRRDRPACDVSGPAHVLALALAQGQRGLLLCHQGASSRRGASGTRTGCSALQAKSQQPSRSQRGASCMLYRGEVV